MFVYLQHVNRETNTNTAMNTQNTPTAGTRFTMYGDLDLVVYEVTDKQIRYHEVGYEFRKFWLGKKRWDRQINSGDIVIAI